MSETPSALGDVLDAAELASFLSPEHHELVAALTRSSTSRQWMQSGMALMRDWRTERARLFAEPSVAEWEGLLRRSRALLAWRRDLP